MKTLEALEQALAREPNADLIVVDTETLRLLIDITREIYQFSGKLEAVIEEAEKAGLFGGGQRTADDRERCENCAAVEHCDDKFGRMGACEDYIRG